MIIRPAYWLATVAMILGGVAATLRGQTATAPSIASISASQTVTEGNTVTLTVSVNGTAPFTYQWKKEGVAIAAATTNSLVLNPIRVADAGTYTVAVTNPVTTITSGPVVLAVTAATAPSLSWSGGSLSCTIGNTLGISVYFSGSSPMTFQWKKDGVVVPAATNQGYSKTNIQSSDAGSYTVTATNIAGSATSNPYIVTVSQPTPPTISTLSNISVNVGDYFSFWPDVSGGSPITCQWYKDGVAIAGAESAYFSRSSAQASDAGVYTLKATNSAGTTTSNGATLTLRPAAAPTIGPMGGPITVAVGGSLSIYASAGGTSPLSFQWRKDGQVIPGATTSSYSKSNVQTVDAGAYSVVVTNSVGSITSSAVTVTVTNAKPPIITYMPGSRTVRVGDWLGYIDVGVSGTAPLSYQWYRNGAAISGATSSSLYLSNAETAEAGTYTVVVSNKQGSVTSQGLVVTVLPPLPPTITEHPRSRTIKQGQSFSLDLTLNGTAPFTFQWKKDGVAIAGGTGSGYSKGNAAASDGGTYSVTITNSAGSATSNEATISVVPDSAPKIIGHPASASLLPGNSFSGLYVSVRSASPASIQWYRDGVAIPDARSSSYYLWNAQPSIAGTYHAVVTNSAGSATSHSASITVDSNATRPAITYVSGGQTVTGGNSVQISISTSGSGETVQWYKDGVVIPNGTDKTYSFSSFKAASAGSYTAQVTNANGTFTSPPISLELLDAGMAPVIISQPKSTVVTGSYGYFGFSVETEGERPQTFQWKKDGLAIAGATDSSASFHSAPASSVGSYTVLVTNRNGSVTSAAATVTFAPSTATAAPVILAGPPSQTVTAGSTINIGVNVQDATGVSYQWYKDGAAVANGTSSSLYYYQTATLTHAGQYYVVVTNSAGSATSNTAVIAVDATVNAPSFTTHPASQTKYYGNTVTFTAAATGTGTVSYQWRRNGSNIAGATTATLTLFNVQSSDVGTYTVVATDSVGSASSLPATLTLSGGSAPTLTTSPAPATVIQGATVVFTASANGTPAPTYQWQKNGINIAGATNGTLTLANVQPSDEATYRFVATNGLGSATADAKLTLVYPPPSITKQPTSISVQPGALATFSVQVTAYPVPTYQWRKNGSAISGANTNTLVVPNAQPGDAGRYSVVVTTAFGSATSAEAVLTVGNPISVTTPQNQTVYEGGTATFTCTVTATDPLVFAWAKNGTTIPGATGPTLTISNAQLTDAATYTFGVSRPDGTVVYPLSGNGALFATLTVLKRTGPVITRHPVSVEANIGDTVTLSVAAVDNGPITYQWQKLGSAPIPDRFENTLVLQNIGLSDVGDYRVTAMGTNGSTTSEIATVSIASSPYAGTYFGSTGSGDAWALHVARDGTGTFLAIMSGRNQAVVARGFRISADGGFTFGPAVSAQALQAAVSEHYHTGLVAGTISSGAVNGSFKALGVQFSGMVKSGTTVSGGEFRAVPLASDLGMIAVIVAPDGTAMLVAVDSSGVKGGRGIVSADGALAVLTPQHTFLGRVSPAEGTLTGTYTPATGAPIAFATLAEPSSPERLVNVATRGHSASGSRMLTAGFVISGTLSKDVLIRAVGPGLTQYGLTGILSNPSIRLFKDGAPIMYNDDWMTDGFASEISSAATRVGAFSLTASSTDSALIARLAPGAYTAQVNGAADESGIVLIEVYDASTSKTEPQKLVNLSTRGFVDQGSSVMIAGVVVNGTAPKKLLIRAVGPALVQYGVSDALPDPKLELYQGTTVLQQNDNWSDSPDSATVAETAVSVGAFPLSVGSKDASILVYLAPGTYTAVVSGVGSGTGVALVEVYEVP